MTGLSIFVFFSQLSDVADVSSMNEKDLVARVEMFLSQMENIDQMTSVQISEASSIISYNYLRSLDPVQLKQVTMSKRLPAW